MRDTQRQRVYDAEARAFAGQHRAFTDHGGRGEYVGRCRAGSPAAGPGSYVGEYAPAGDIVWYRQRVTRKWHPGALRTIRDCQAFVDRVVGSRWWRARQGDRGIGHVTVRDGRGRSRTACADYFVGTGRVIKLPLWGRTRPVILHELAHHLAGLEAKHGPDFARAYLDLVRRWIGRDAAARLRAEYRAGRVKVSRTVGVRSR